MKLKYLEEHLLAILFFAFDIMFIFFHVEKKQFERSKAIKYSLNDFALKAAIEKRNETRLLEGEATMRPNYVKQCRTMWNH